MLLFAAVKIQHLYEQRDIYSARKFYLWEGIDSTHVVLGDSKCFSQGKFNGGNFLDFNTLPFLSSKHRLYFGRWTCSVPHEPQQPNGVSSSCGRLPAEALWIPGWKWEPKQNLPGGRWGRVDELIPFVSFVFLFAALFSLHTFLIIWKLHFPSVSTGIRETSEWQTTTWAHP